VNRSSSSYSGAHATPWLLAGCGSLLVVFALLLASCASDVQEGPPPVLDRAQFDLTAYPILIRDCAFPDCHASEERFLQVFGPGRVRLTNEPMFDVFACTGEPEAPASCPTVVEQERSLAYGRAVSMLTAGSVDDSLLLRKPLAEDEGGAPHRGTDELGRNVYLTKSDPGWQALRAWAAATTVTTP
jgi:hypothetical protein